MAQKTIIFEYDLSKTPGFIYVLANFLGSYIYIVQTEDARIYGAMWN